MAITQALPTLDTTVRVVCSEDPDVDAKEGAGKGWILHKDATVRDGASVVELRPMNADQRASSADAGGVHQCALAKCRTGIVSVNGDKSKDAREAFLRGCDSTVVFLLGRYVDAITNGVDPKEDQSRFFRGLDEIERK